MADNYEVLIHSLLKKHWGYDSFRPMQKEIIMSVLEGNDTLGLLPTGGGKSITFQIPALAREGLTIVVTPLISLMKDQVDNLRSHGIHAGQLYHGLRPSETELVLNRCRYGKIKILYLSPEKLRSPQLEAWWNELPVSMIVVDEAHCISQWGYDFRPSYLRIRDLRARYPHAPVLALTASATPEVVEDIMRQLDFRRTDKLFRLSFMRRNISYIVRRCDIKFAELQHILECTQGSGIVYTRSRRRTHELAAELNAAGISADFYHAGLSPEDKNEKQNRWKSGQVRIMVATNAFGMGIDKPDVRIVIHHDLPSSLEEYYQEAGRAGRDGLPSWAVVLATVQDKGTLTRRLNESFPPKDYIREVYEKAMVWLGVGMGEWFGRMLEFNPDKFCERWQLQPASAESAMRILSQSGYFEYIDEVEYPPRLMMTITRRRLYDIQLKPETERILQFILRNYTGIFADYERISESLIASSLDLTERTVYENLIQLRQMHVIDFVPRRRTPYVMITMSRVPKSDILFPKEIYENRRENMRMRLEAMRSFVFKDEKCRVRTMLEYFGESADDCGTCDVCRGKKVKRQKSAPELIAEAVLQVLGMNETGMTASMLAARLMITTEELLPVLRTLADDRRIRLEPPLIFPV